MPIHHQGLQNPLGLLATILLPSTFILIVDVVHEVDLLLQPGRNPGLLDQFHVAFEAAATLMLLVGAVYAFRLFWAVRCEGLSSHAKLTNLRDDFDGILQQRFDNWGLSPAERDVALLTIRGLSIAELAMARKTSQGTIKAQLSTIYRKTETSSRVDLMSVIMEEFLDHCTDASRSVRRRGSTLSVVASR